MASGFTELVAEADVQLCHITLTDSLKFKA